MAAATIPSVTVHLTVKAENAGPSLVFQTNITCDAAFTHAITPTATTTSETPTATTSQKTIQDIVCFNLDADSHGEVTISDVVVASSLIIDVLGPDGRALIVRSVPVPAGENGKAEVLVTLLADEVKKLQASAELPKEVPALISRPAQLVSITPINPPIDFSRAQLQIAPITIGDNVTWDSLEFPKVLNVKDLATAAKYVQEVDIPIAVLGLDWSLVRVAVDGKFTATFPPPGDVRNGWTAWVWLLSGSNLISPILGVVSEIIKQSIDRTRSVFLPPLPKKEIPGNGGTGPDGTATPDTDFSNTNSAPDEIDCHCNTTQRIPAVVSEAELAANPGVYTEDPGAFCKPFSNPARILSERSFFSVIRTEQPVISAEASIQLREPAQLDFDPPDEMLEGINGQPGDYTATRLMMLRPDIRLGSGAFNLPSIVEDKTTFINGSIVRNKIRNGLDVVVDRLPSDLFDIINALNRGRKDLSAANPVQWDSESIRYQATTVSRGHILEFRVRTRSNGYSLGGVAKTLTLAPRQTKRIQKIEWSRSERATRVERQNAANTVNDSMVHDTSYQDAVGANLNEWAQGSSSSSVTSAAAGVGAVLGPVAIGGGVAHSSAQSSSQQSGGRTTTANEEMQWRDAMRRHGDDLRKFESMVVQEVTQSEEVTGTVEVVRNINYAHSLTILYHNVLRHLRVDTEFGGARECLFVPFAMKPFTMQRAYRWRETIRKVLRDRRFNHAMRYLKDILTGFKYSQIPPGRRADHPIKSLYGSIYINLGICRPADNDKGEFKPENWVVLNPFLPFPALAIFQSLAAQVEALRELEFQRRYAPGIAAKWCDLLRIIADNGSEITADFTLASSYSYSQTVRIDFQVSNTDGLTRSGLTSLKVLAGNSLNPGSVANLRSMNYTYQTDYETVSTYLSQGVGDLVLPDTGAIDSSGAVLKAPLTQNELQNLRADLVYETVEMLQHLNENIEYYHRMIWWNMDRDRLFMLLDGFFVPPIDPKAPKTSIASVVERNPIGIAGNSLIFRVSAGCFVRTAIGDAILDTPEKLDNWYKTTGPISDPMHISLPTDGLYAQTIMDECIALEEHYGSLDWALNDPDPELGTIDASLLASRRSDTSGLGATKLPDTLIQLQNGSAAPAPQGLAGILGAVQNANDFRDMAGLAGTQGLATKGLETAAALATTFGGNATSLKLAELANKKAATEDADKKIATIQKAKEKGLTSDEDAKQHTNEALGQMNGNNPTATVDETKTTPKETKEAIKVIEDEVKKGNVPKTEGKKRISEQVSNMKGSAPAAKQKGRQRGLVIRLIGQGNSPLQGEWTWELTQLQVIPGPENVAVDAALAGTDAPRLYETGRILVAFTQDPNTAETYDFHLRGKLLGTRLQVDPDVSGLPVNTTVHMSIPNSLFDKANVATATVIATLGHYEVKNKKGHEATSEWKLGANVGAEGGTKMIAKIVGSIDGEKTWGETESSEQEQTWTFYYYTGGFDQTVTVD